ncbi:MAG: hypothetical protein J1F67_01535 [Muribaculaceae bacterium]|nr:hypothetical protein [Muribaculaceae bacterium]
MKIKLFCGIGVTLLVLSACTEEKFSYEAPDVNSADLVEGKAYSVTIDPETNLVTLKNLLGDSYVASWVTPNGITKGSEVSFSLPFSGNYEVQFGVMTRGGMVYGNPYTFELPYNNFSLLSDEIWTNLAGGVEVEDDGTVISNPVTWVPMNRKFGKHNGSAPVTYLSPDDVHNNGSGDNDLKFGTDNWTENWDPGFQSWLIDSDNPYMDSEMTMYLDAQQGCVAEIKRVTSSGETNYTTTFNLNLSDPDRPTVTFNQGDMLYAEWGNGMCSNYSTDIKLIECTPYVLQFATMRTNSEGPWWIVWNFIRKELKEDPSLFPTDGPELQEVSDPKLPSYENLEELLFTIVGDDASYLSTQTTLVMDEEKPYDIYYWNNAGEGNWEWMNGYGSSWAPAYGGAEDFSLTLSKKWEDLDNDGVKESPYFEGALENPENTKTTRFTIGENSITFNEPLILMSAGNYLMRAREFTVLRCAPEDEEIILGIPDGYDANNNCNRYLAVGLKIKGVSGGQEGPTLVQGDNAKLGVYVEASDHLRLELYNPWGSNNWFNDISKLKLKKNQTATINFKLEGVDWKDGAQPRVLFANNVDALGFSWPTKGEGFDQDHTILNTATGEGTATLTNTTGGTITFEGTGCVTLCIEINGLTNSPVEEDGSLAAGIKGEIISFSIQ